MKIKHKRLDKSSQIILKEFIETCLSLDTNRLENLFNKHPIYFESEAEEGVSLLSRTKEIFNEFIEGNPCINVIDRKCTGCSYGGLTKKFIVTYKNEPHRNSSFGFLIKQKNNCISSIHECSQYKSYQDKLHKKMYLGMTEEQIKEEKEASKGLPPLGNNLNFKQV